MFVLLVRQVLRTNASWHNTTWHIIPCPHGWTYDYSIFYPTITSQVRRPSPSPSFAASQVSLSHEISTENYLLAPTFVNPLSVLQHWTFPPLSHLLSRENRISPASLSSYYVFRKTRSFSNPFDVQLLILLYPLYGATSNIAWHIPNGICRSWCAMVKLYTYSSRRWSCFKDHVFYRLYLRHICSAGRI